MSCDDVEDSVPISTGEAAPNGSVPHSEPIVNGVLEFYFHIFFEIIDNRLLL
jgi:hypothetical protein